MFEKLERDAVNLVSDCNYRAGLDGEKISSVI